MSEQQRLTSVSFKRLKGLRNVTFNLGDKNVTGIFGPNGCGKSTILHALLCLYKPKPGSSCTNYKYSHFFISMNTERWLGSELSYKGTYSEGGVQKTFHRTIKKRSNRWLKDYGTRPDRDVFFIDISSCVPDVESEKLESVRLLTYENIKKSPNIMQIASDVMNFDYSEYDYVKGGRKKYYHCKNGPLSYISLSMGAGEQRLFRILQTVVNAPKYSLIVIDEVDLTLHSRALNKLIKHLVKIADNNKLQIVFTSHRQELVGCPDINVRHLVPPIGTRLDTLCLEHTTIDCVERLTGKSINPIEIYVEDDLAKCIINEIVADLKMRKYVAITTFGAIVNAFIVISGLYQSGKLTENIIAITDGDEYNTDAKRENIVKSYITGTESDIEERRNKVLAHIKQFNLPESKSPEEFIWETLKNMHTDSEIVEEAAAIRGVCDKHQYLYDLSKSINKPGQYTDIIQEFKKETAVWEAYTKDIREWLEQAKTRI